MLSLCFVVLTSAVLEPAYGAIIKRTSCPQEYLDISPDHTMCLTDVGQQLPLTNADIQAAVTQHNDIRTRVSPSATDMLRLEWDEDLASVASKWAAQCQVAHDSHRSLPGLPGVWVGQNLAAGNHDLSYAIAMWESEIEDFHYGSSPTGVVGHYTQIVNARTVLVGCGVADCPSSQYRKFQVCNYAAGQYSSAQKTPYTDGTICNDCPNSCNADGLCDCNGKICVNGGNLNIDSCQCSCPAIHTGNYCQTLNCIADQGYCPQYVQYYGPNVCDIYTNVPQECPHMCGLC